MTGPLRAGVVGLGAMGRNHARILGQLPGVELVACADPAALGRRQHGAPVLGGVAELLERDLDYVVIACPTALHEEVGQQVAGRGVAALIEKPLAHTVEAGRRLLEAFGSRGLVAGVGHIERFNPALQDLRRRLAGAARQRAAERYSVDAMLDGYQRLLREVSARG